jgi:hypothetical protein
MHHVYSRAVPNKSRLTSLLVSHARQRSGKSSACATAESEQFTTILLSAEGTVLA